MALLAVGPGLLEAQEPAARGTLTAFQSETELQDYLHALMRRRLQRRDSLQRSQRRRAAEIANCRPARSWRQFPRSDSTAVIVTRFSRAGDRRLPYALARTPLLARFAVADSSGTAVLVIPAEMLRAPRAVTVTARALGYSSDSLTVTIAAGDSIELSFRMCESATRLENAIVHSAMASVTNVQHAGVDEGGIVKLHGDFLVILRRGRLYTVRVGRGAPRAVDAVNAYGPGIDPDDTWYDELLVAGDRVVVVGYSYDRGGTEIGVFRLDGRGRLHYESTHQLRSGDYYSSRNYASRLVGSKLIFYAPVHLPDDTLAIAEAIPAMRTWRHVGAQGEFRPIVSARRVYRPVFDDPDGSGVTLHTVTTCELAAGPLRCEAGAFIGGSGREFYMSATAVYIWTAGASRWEGGAAVVHRMPFDGRAPTALRVTGGPVDQFSFLESEDGHLNVVTDGSGAGGAMWNAEQRKWGLRLLRVPLSSLGDGRDSAPASAYRPLAPSLPGATQNRFIGDYVIVGSGTGWQRQTAARSDVYIMPWKGGEVRVLPLQHDVERIEAMGREAVVIGADMRDLHFTALGLDGQGIRRYAVAGASQGELRSHGFFYRPSDDRSGVLGLPIRQPGKPGYAHLFEESAAIVFLRNTPRGFIRMGTLDADPRAAADDRCVASCVDWYGNARPLFIGNRIFALLGAELVEGRVSGGRMRARRRVDITGALR